MQLTNTMKKTTLLSLLALSASFYSNAESQTIEGSFRTIKDVSIDQVAGNELEFVGLLMTQTTGTCDMPVPNTGAGYMGDTLMKLANTTNSNAPSPTVGTIGAVANACVGGTGTIGIFEIDGSPGTTVKITVSPVTTGSIGFTPAGCAGNYDGGSNNDSCVALTSGGAGTAATGQVKLASAGDTTNSAGEGVPEPGKSRLAVGGTVQALVGLSAATPYSVDFDIAVTY